MVQRGEYPKSSVQIAFERVKLEKGLVRAASNVQTGSIADGTAQTRSPAKISQEEMNEFF